MKILNFIFVFSPLLNFAQSVKPSQLELCMFNNKEVIVSVDGRQYEACSKFQLSGITSGKHKIKVFQTKKYINPLNQSVSKRLIPVYFGEVYVSDSKCTSCLINKYHQNEVKIQR